MTRILITQTMPGAVVARAQEHFEVELRASDARMKPGEMRAALTLHDGVLTTFGARFSQEIFGAGEHHRCRIIANYGVGVNHIDIAAANAAGIVVTNTPGAVTDATADIAMTLLLMSARRAGEGERMVRAGGWTGWTPTQMMGLHVTGKTVAIIGMGRIGQAVARRCHFGFGMDVLYVSRSDKRLEYPARRVEMHQAAAGADVIVIAVPGGVETHHLIDRSFFAAMQSHAHVVNVSRGDVVNEADLIRALEDGVIAGAGLDVYEHEPEVPQALRALENAVLLPHLGTNALEVREAIGFQAVENLRAFFAGEPPPDVVR